MEMSAIEKFYPQKVEREREKRRERERERERNGRHGGDRGRLSYLRGASELRVGLPMWSQRRVRLVHASASSRRGRQTVLRVSRGK